MLNRIAHRASRITHHASRITFYVSRHQHFVLVLIIFLTFRLMLPFVFRNGSYFVEAAPDLRDYLNWGTLADSGLYPFVDYWSEYPPLFAWSVIGLYRLSALLPAWLDQRLWFSIAMQTAMAIFDLGSVILVYGIALRLGSQTRAIRTAALFAGAFITAYAASGWYEPVPLFFLLWALYLALTDRFGRSALAASVGLMTKIVPILIVPIALRRMTQLRQQVGYLSLVVVASLGLILPFLIAGADYVLAFIRATFNRPTWLSIWALLDGNYSFGATIPIVDRFSPANIGTADASQLPWPIIHLTFLGLFLFVYTRRMDWRDSIKSIAFAGFTVNLFLLWSKGFSGQFVVYVVPFVALLMPNLRGALYTALLSVLWVAEWPIAFQMLEGQHWFIAWLVIMRTAILIALCLEYVVRLSPIAYRLSPIATAILVIGWISVVPIGIASISAYTQTRLAADPAATSIDLIRASSSQSGTIVFAAPRIFRRLYPAARSIGDPVLLPTARHTPEEVRMSWLDEIATRGPFWFIADEGDADTRQENLDAEAWVSDRACKVATMLTGSARVSRFVGALTSVGDTGMPTKVGTTRTFADEIELVGFQLSEHMLRPGSGLCVELNWQVIQAPSADYTAFVHLVDSQGRLVAQNDQQPQGGFAPTSVWTVGSAIADKHGLILSADLPPGEYIVRVGLYRSDDQSPVRVTHGERLLPDATGIILATVSVIP